MPQEITVEDLQNWMNEDRSYSLLDVREDRERAIVKLDDDLHVPVSGVPEKIDDINNLDKPIVVYCHHGIRSMQVTRLLIDQGFEDVVNLQGGIHAWATDINDDLPTY